MSDEKKDDKKVHEKKNELGTLTVRNRGKINMSEIYSKLHQIISDYGYSCPEDGSGYFETEYFQEDSQFGKNIKFKWVAHKGQGDFYKSELKLSFEIMNLQDVEKVENNKKVVSNQGDVKIKIEANIYEKLDEGISSIFQNWFKSFKSEYDQQAYDDVEEDTFDAFMTVHSTAKKLLNITA